MKRKKLSKEHKKILSEKMKLAHKDGRHPGWKHINENKNYRSYPEKFFLKIIENNELDKKYKIIEKFSYGKYFLDFAFIDIKLDVEIDGSQHLQQDHIKHDNIRNNYLIDRGWNVYRINWIEFNKNKKREIEKFLKYLNNEDKKNIFYNIEDCLYRQNKKTYRELYVEKQKKYIDVILNSNIDFSKIGWVGEVAKILKRTPQKVNKWMKKYMLKFYNDNCFKRRCPSSSVD